MAIPMVLLGWAAGLIEGEGCITYSGSKRWPTLALQVSSTDRDVLEQLIDIFGGRVVGGKRQVNPQDKSKLCKHIFRVAWTGDRAAAIIMTLYPLLGQRRKTRAEQLLGEWRKRHQTKMEHRP